MTFRQKVAAVRLALKAVGVDVRHTRVRAGRADDCWGFWSQADGIVIDSSLRGAAFWRVLLHEYGHALGLDHTRRGLMRVNPLRGFEHETDPPTAIQKKRWVLQIARLALQKRGVKARF